MPNGGTVRINAENATMRSDKYLPEGEYVKIMIRDEGEGISKENIEKIFDPFFTTKSSGTGLGLTISFSIIRRHNGNISVESEIGKGTTFFVYLPASQKDAEEVAEKDEISIRGHGKILLMDDEKDLRDTASTALEHLGYIVKFAKDGKEAIKLYKEALNSRMPFDLVILDLVIPGGMGGKETIAELKKIDPKVKAVVSSGYSNDPVVSNYKEHGFIASLPKPYSIEEMSKILHGFRKTFFKK